MRIGGLILVHDGEGKFQKICPEPIDSADFYNPPFFTFHFSPSISSYIETLCQIKAIPLSLYLFLRQYPYLLTFDLRLLIFVATFGEDMIYIVTSGEYSSYSICGVFDNKELADGFIKMYNNCEMEIEEWELNPNAFEIANGYKSFFVEMDKDGNTKDIETTESNYSWHGFKSNGNLYKYCLAIDGAHAIKITNELRTRLIAENKWCNY